MTYRPEIDGLRAIAVGMIILFHAGFAGVSGGYIGVDIFFVLSGYLITGLILKDQESDDFSVTRFYQRRARRILPAMLAMVVVVLAVGFVVFPPMQFQWLAQSALATNVFASNIYFMLKGGDYFAQDVFFPLKHTWSLGVEEQFYLVLPGLLILVGRFGRRASSALVTVCFLASLSLAVWFLDPMAQGYYYNPLPRAWELLAGSLLAFLPAAKARRWSDGAVFIGLAMVFWSAVALEATTPFPSAVTIIPILGTMIVVRYAVDGTHSARVLSIKPFVAVGLISYSLYLWHYPVYSFAHFYGADTTATGGFLASLALIVALSVASYRFVEMPVRFGIRRRSAQNAAAVLLLACCAALALLSFGINLTGGMPGRGNVAGLPADYFQNAGKAQRFVKGVDGRLCTQGCLASQGDGERWWLVGDSHANDFREETVRAAREAGANLSLLIIPGCSYSPMDCQKGMDRLSGMLDEGTPDRLFFVSSLNDSDPDKAFRMSSDTSMLLETARVDGARVVVLSSRPRFVVDPVRLALTGRRDEIALAPEWRAARETGETVRFPETFRMVDQTELLLQEGCGQLDCFDGHTKDGHPLYRDTNHLTRQGAGVVFAAALDASR